jgi:hypothetical protein
MNIVDIQTIRKIGEEFGWTERQLELALANAIRLSYVDRAMLVEVDVNLELAAITVRRRSGFGEHGVWIDINNPILPSTKQLIGTMELMQWRATATAASSTACRTTSLSISRKT